MRQIKNRETTMRQLAAEIAAKSQQLAAISHHKITHAESSFAAMTESVATLLVDGGHVKTVIKVTPHIINNIADYKTSIIDSYIVNLDGFGEVVLHEILFYGEIVLISEELF